MLHDYTYSHIKKLVGVQFYSLRIGECKVILDVNNNELRILVIHINHRKEVYKRL